MTAREQEILAIIQENPMISQNEIADRLDLTRSSVSVYIANMIKCGVLKGRGYVVAEEDYPIIIGAAAVDIISTFKDTFSDASSNWVPQQNCKIDFFYSGGAKNLAENVARLGGQPKIISAIAYDLFGSEIVRECNQHGISTEHCLFLNNEATTMYLDVVGPQISISGLANNSIDQNITPEFLETKYIHLKKASQIVIEDRLPVETIDYLTSTFQTSQLFLMTSRRFSHVANYLQFFDRFTAMQFSFQVASYLCGMDNSSLAGTVVSDSIIRRMASVLLLKAKDAQMIVFPAYGNQICLASREGIFVISMPGDGAALDSFKITRDAMMAGMMYCLPRDYSKTDTLLFIAACHEIASRTECRAVNRNMCLKLVRSTMDELRQVSNIRRL